MPGQAGFDRFTIQEQVRQFNQRIVNGQIDVCNRSVVLILIMFTSRSTLPPTVSLTNLVALLPNDWPRAGVSMRLKYTLRQPISVADRLACPAVSLVGLIGVPFPVQSAAAASGIR